DEKDSAFGGSPLQENGVIDPIQADMNRTNEVERGHAPAHVAEDPCIEVLIANQLEHPRFSWPWHAPSTWHEGLAAEAGTPRSSRERPWPPVRAGADKRESRPDAASSS